MSEWLASSNTGGFTSIIAVVVALIVVLFLAIVLIGLAKRIFSGTGGIGGRSRAPRLAVLDMAPVDPKRKLVLVRRDDVEHLILIGGQNDLVVEPGIVRGQARRPRQEPGFAEAEQRNAAPVPGQQPLPHRRIPRPSSQPVPDDGQAPGASAPIAPVVEGARDIPQQPRTEASQRARSWCPPSNRRSSDRTQPVSAAPAIDSRAEPAKLPPAPLVIPPVAAPVVSPSRVVEEPPVARRTEPALPAEPTPPPPTDARASRRSSRCASLRPS